METGQAYYKKNEPAKSSFSFGNLCSAVKFLLLKRHIAEIHLKLVKVLRYWRRPSVKLRFMSGVNVSRTEISMLKASAEMI